MCPKCSPQIVDGWTDGWIGRNGRGKDSKSIFSFPSRWPWRTLCCPARDPHKLVLLTSGGRHCPLPCWELPQSTGGPEHMYINSQVTNSSHSTHQASAASPPSASGWSITGHLTTAWEYTDQWEGYSHRAGVESWRPGQTKNHPLADRWGAGGIGWDAGHLGVGALWGSGSNCREVFECFNNLSGHTSASWVTISPAWRPHEEKLYSSLPESLWQSWGDRERVTAGENQCIGSAWSIHVPVRPCVS